MTDCTTSIISNRNEDYSFFLQCNCGNDLIQFYYYKETNLNDKIIGIRYFGHLEDVNKKSKNTSFIFNNTKTLNQFINYLEDMENAIHVFIYADEEAKIVRTMERHQLNREEATKRMKKIDKQRRTYYQYYTEWRWARTEGFDIMLNSSALGVEATVAAIKAIVEAKMK